MIINIEIIRKLYKQCVIFSLLLILNFGTPYQLNAAMGDPADLMQQGKVSRCLHAEWTSEGEGGDKQVRTVRLTGRCEATGGCVCRLNQQPNTSVAADAEGQPLCEELVRMKTPADTAKLARVLGVSTSLLAKWAPKPPMSQAEKDERNRQLRNSCHKHVAEANNPVLGAVPAGIRQCNIIKNNLASAGSPKGMNNVLGVSTDGLIPYGDVDIIVQEETYKHSPVTFSSVGDNTPTVTNENVGASGAGAGIHKTLKNAQLVFEALLSEVTVDGFAKNCVPIQWDPYGRVFDAQTLEPLPDVIVELRDGATKEPVAMKYNLNYDVTGDDGLYNIMVEKEDTYALSVNTLTSHSFGNNPDLNPMWKYIYSDLYNPEDTFVEKQSAPTHHDIALEPAPGEEYRGAVAKIVPGTLKSEDMNGVMVYTGRTTFPMALTCLVDESTGKNVGECVHANNIGTFSIAVKKSEVPPVRLRVAVQKVDLTNPALYKEDAEVEILHMNSLMLPKSQRAFYFEPILSLVEGYAYDSTNTVLPNATVKVVLKANKKPYYETKADGNGFFTIYADNLPILEYYLEFVDAKTGKTSAQTASEFVASNKDYLYINQIDLVSAQKNSTPVEIQKTVGKKVYEAQPVNPLPTEATKQAESSVSYLNIAMIIASIVLLGAVGVGAAVLIKKQSQTV